MLASFQSVWLSVTVVACWYFAVLRAIHYTSLTNSGCFDLCIGVGLLQVTHDILQFILRRCDLTLQPLLYPVSDAGITLTVKSICYVNILSFKLGLAGLTAVGNFKKYYKVLPLTFRKNIFFHLWKNHWSPIKLTQGIFQWFGFPSKSRFFLISVIYTLSIQDVFSHNSPSHSFFFFFTLLLSLDLNLRTKISHISLSPPESNYGSEGISFHLLLQTAIFQNSSRGQW